MPRSDLKGLVAGGMYFVFGIAAALGSLQYPLGTFWRMGPGFFPLMVSIGLVLNGITVAAIAVAPQTAPVGLGDWRLRNLLLVVAAVVAFALVIRPGGVVLAIIALVGIASFTTSGLKPRDVLISMAALSLLTWLVFIRLIGLQLSMLPGGFGL